MGTHRHESVKGYPVKVVLDDKSALVSVIERNGCDDQRIIQYPEVLDFLFEPGFLVFGEVVGLQGLENEDAIRIFLVAGLENGCLRGFGYFFDQFIIGDNHLRYLVENLALRRLWSSIDEAMENDFFPLARSQFENPCRVNCMAGVCQSRR